MCTAGRLFAEEGTHTTLERIAEVAGVGVGTIYRRFASIDELVAVVLEEKMASYADRAEEFAAQSSTQPWEAFEGYVRFILEQQTSDLAFSQVILDPSGASRAFQSEIRRAFTATLTIVETAKAAGAVRADLDHSDLLLLIHANAGIVGSLGQAAREASARFGQYMLEAFRDVTAPPLPPPPRAWARASGPGSAGEG